MPSQPERIAEDLRGQISGEVHSDLLTRQLYATDASLYEIMPSVVVRPRITSDVAATLRYADQEGLPVHARGSGSGLAGGCLGEGIVIDFSRFMRRVLSTGEDQVTVQPGLVHSVLNQRLLLSGRHFAPDPFSTLVTTIGGMAAIDASGSHRPLYGSMRDHVVGMRLVLADGTILTLGEASKEPTQEETDRKNNLARQLNQLILSRTEMIREHSPHNCANVSGYALEKATLPDGRVDLLQLMIGSEGTLGLISELTLKTVAKPDVTGTMLMTFTSLDRAAQAVQELLPFDLAACDLLDRRHIGLARELDPRYELLLSGAAEAALCVEVVAEDAIELNSKLVQILNAVKSRDLVAEILVAESDEDRKLYRDLRDRFVATLHGLKGVRRAATGVEAIAVPPVAMPQFFTRLQEILKRRQVTASVFSHVTEGQIHLRPLLDVSNTSDLRKLEALASDLYDTVWLLGGTMTGAYGDGLSRTPFTSRQHGPLVNVFREVKSIFDPRGTLNPGKVVPAPGGRMTHRTRRQTLPDSANRLDESLQEVTAYRGADLNNLNEEETPELVDLQLSWNPDEILKVSRACNGCGVCRSVEEGGRMCPVFRFSPREEASPRAKANMLRSILTGRLDPEVLLKDETKQVADLCVNCHMCRLDCPAEVDIPKLMLEAKAAYVKTNGLTISGNLSMRLDIVAWWLAKAPRTFNHLFRRPWFRWLLERTIGLARGRKIPKIATRPYLKQAASRRLHLPVKVKKKKSEQAIDAATESDQSDKAEKVFYFVDTYANYFDSELAVAFERVIRRHGIEFYAPQDQQHSGMSMISQGAVDTAIRFAEQNVLMLAEAIRQGYRIVATEPAAVLALTHEYRHLLPEDEDAQLVAENTYEACHYLWRRHLDSQLQLDLQPLPVKIAYHVPCHIRALRIGTPSENLLRLIPELKATRLDKGCSGMAGTFGLSRKNYRSSLRAGLPMLSALRSGDYQIGATECGACRTQMEQTAPIETLHPVKLLAASYGVMPELYEKIMTASTQNAIK